MLDPATFAVVFIAILLASAVQAITGFGFGIVAMPLLTLFISPKLALPITVMNGVLLNIVILISIYTYVELRRIWPLVLAGMAGVPFGVWILANWDVDVLRVYLGAVTIGLTLLFLTGFSREVQHEKLALLPIGFASGVMGGSINMPGPPVILFLTNQRLARLVFRANIVAYFLIVALWTLPILVATRILDFAAFGTAALLVPGLVIGALAGGILAHRVNDIAMRRITLVIVLAAGIVSLLAGFDLT